MALSTRQLACIEQYVNDPSLTIASFCRKAGIGETTWYRWKENQEFCETLEKKLKEAWEEARAIAQQSMIKQASEGSFQASKYILDNMGYGATQKHELKSDNTITINIGVEENGDKSEAE